MWVFMSGLPVKSRNRAQAPLCLWITGPSGHNCSPSRYFRNIYWEVISPSPDRAQLSIEAKQTTSMEIECRRSFAFPLGFHAGQLGLPLPQICTVQPKMLDLSLDICEHAIDLLKCDREPDRPLLQCLPALLTVQTAFFEREWKQRISDDCVFNCYLQ